MCFDHVWANGNVHYTQLKTIDSDVSDRFENLLINQLIQVDNINKVRIFTLLEQCKDSVEQIQNYAIINSFFEVKIRTD